MEPRGISAPPVVEESVKELISYMPDFKGKTLLELNAGCGLLTQNLATLASHVTAVDGSQHNINKNTKSNKHLGNITFMCADFNNLYFPGDTFDVVVSGDTFRSMSDSEATRLLSRVLTWIKPDGHLIMREITSYNTGTIVAEEGTTTARSPAQYCQLLVGSTSESAHLHVVRSKSLLSHIKRYGDPSQLLFLARRMEGPGTIQGTPTMDIRYSRAFIRKLEWIFGHMWVSTGGESTTRVQFEIGDITEADYEDNSYDLIYSRDCILHIEDKKQLFAKLYRWLKPGGKIFTTDYCRGTGELSQEYLDYEKKSYSAFVTVESYGKSLEEAGFKDVLAEDLKDEFYEIQTKELEHFLPTREAFVEEFSQEEFDALVKIASNKLPWVKEKQFTWGSFTAHK